MVLLDIDEFIWPEYVPPSDDAASTTVPDKPPTGAADKKSADSGGDDGNDEEEGRRLYSGEGDAALIPSHVPRFSPRTKRRAAAACLLVIVLLLLTISLTLRARSSRAPRAGAPSTVAGAPPPSAAAPHPMDTSGSPDAVANATATSTNASTTGSSSGSSASDGENVNDDDPCPIELSAAHKCFVEQQQNRSTSALSTSYFSPSVAQSECVSCLATLWPPYYLPMCGMDNATLCQEMLSCDCGACSGLVSAYLICATNCSSGINDDGLLTSMPASCQQLLEVDPSPSTIDLLPPEPTNTTFTEQGNSSSTSTSPPAPMTTQPPSPMPTPSPRCHNASTAFNECVDPDQGDGANCLLCLLSYWPSSSGPADDDTSSATTTTTATSTLACDDELVNATCVGLDMCDNHCHGCRDAYITFLQCQVDTCHDASSTSVFLCP